MPPQKTGFPSLSQPQRFSYNSSGLCPGTAVGVIHGVAEDLFVDPLMQGFKMGSAQAKSMSATHLTVGVVRQPLGRLSIFVAEVPDRSMISSKFVLAFLLPPFHIRL